MPRTQATRRADERVEARRRHRVPERIGRGPRHGRHAGARAEPGARLRGSRPRRGRSRQDGGVPLPHRAATERRHHLDGRRRLGGLRVLRRRGRGWRADSERRPDRPGRPAPHVVLQRTVVHANTRIHHDGPTAHATRPLDPSHVRHAGRARRGNHAPGAPLGLRVRDPGGREVAHGREPGEPAAERRVRRLLRVPVGLGHVHGVA